MPDSGSLSSPLNQRATAALLVLGIAAALFTLACHVTWRNEPFDASKAGAVGADQFGYSARAFDACGWLDLRLAPSSLFVRGENTWSLPYLHHPFLPYSLTYASWVLGGRTESALRWPALAAFVVTCIAVAVLGHMCAGRAAAGLALAFFAVQPVAIQYGNMVDSVPLALASMLIAAVAWFRATRNASCRDSAHVAANASLRLRWFLAAAFLCGLLGWYGYMLVPALWLDLLLFAPRKVRSWRTAFAIGLPFGLAAMLHFAWSVWVLGSVERAAHEAGWLFSTFSGGEGLDWYATDLDASCLVALSHFFVEGSGWPLLALAAAGIIWGLARAGRSVFLQSVRLPLIIALAGLLSSVAFWTRACTHEFFVLLAAPGLALLAASAALRATTAPALATCDWPRWLRIGMPAALLMGILGCLTLEGLQLHAGLRQESQRELGQCLSSLCTDGDVLLLATAYSPGQRFCINNAVIPGAADERVFHWTMNELRPARHAVRRVLLVTNDECLQFLGWLEAVPDLMKRETCRRISCAGEQLTVVELDRDICLR